jgi:uncharacterized RmlC-like cupin family protein
MNQSATKAARAVVVRNDPNEQEHVILYEADAEARYPQKTGEKHD